jgi:transcriptional regulator with XRE-family HTH domain
MQHPQGKYVVRRLLAVQTSRHQRAAPYVRKKQQTGRVMRAATDIDKKVGENLCKFRLLRGMSQVQLAEAVGVTFQQIQKYEKSTNRISASRLWQFSKILKIDVDDFYDGIEGAVRNDALKLAPEQLTLVNKYNALPEPQKQAVQDYVAFLRKKRG